MPDSKHLHHLQQTIVVQDRAGLAQALRSITAQRATSTTTSSVPAHVSDSLTVLRSSEPTTPTPTITLRAEDTAPEALYYGPAEYSSLHSGTLTMPIVQPSRKDSGRPSIRNMEYSSPLGAKLVDNVPPGALIRCSSCGMRLLPIEFALRTKTQSYSSRCHECRRIWKYIYDHSHAGYTIEETMEGLFQQYWRDQQAVQAARPLTPAQLKAKLNKKGKHTTS